MRDMFLQETEATVLNFDLRGFTMIAAHLGPVDLGALLGRFYTHAEASVEAGGGRLVKFMSDVVMSVFIDGQHGSDHGGHRRGALRAIRHAQASRTAWLAENKALQLPLLTYSMAASSGKVLVGQIGTEKLQAFDVLGAPASVAFKLTQIATMRDVDNLVTLDVLGSRADGAIESEAVALGGHRYRTFQVE